MSEFYRAPCRSCFMVRDIPGRPFEGEGVCGACLSRYKLPPLPDSFVGDDDEGLTHRQPFILYVFKDGRQVWKKYETYGQMAVCYQELVQNEPEEKTIANMEEWILQVAESGMTYKRIKHIFRLTEMRTTNVDGVDILFHYYQQVER